MSIAKVSLYQCFLHVQWIAAYICTCTCIWSDNISFNSTVWFALRTSLFTDPLGTRIKIKT